MENLKSVDTIESNKIREKLKDTCNKNGKSRTSNKSHHGPLIAKHNTAYSPTSPSQVRRKRIDNDSRTITSPIKSFESRSSPNHRKISVTSPQARSNCRGIITSRHRSPSLSHSRQSSPSSIHHQRRRTPSPANLFDPQQVEIILKRLEKLPQVKFYFLRQPGPNSFLITAENAENKYKVVIGPQTCSCGKGPHCLHLLFVLVRVLQVKPTDSYVWNKTLKDYEVETLLKRYHAKRKSLVSNSKKKMKRFNSNQEIVLSSATSSTATTPTSITNKNLEEEEEEAEEYKCVICLSEMFNDDRLFVCKSGCRNKMHHHCISIWAEERRKQNEKLECPLCRMSLTFSSFDHQQSKCTKSYESSSPTTNNSGTNLPSPLINISTPGMPSSNIILIDQYLPLPNTDSIPESYRESVQPWIDIFGSNLVACFFSRDWAIRETALRRLTREVITVLLHDSEQDLRMVGTARRRVQADQHYRLTQNLSPFGGGIINKSKEAVLKCCSNIITLVTTDPVYKVYIACLRCLRALLAYSSCRMDQDITFLQSLVRPILDTIILRCADANKRINQLSIATVLEFCRGQCGALTVGNLARYPPRVGLGGVKFVLNSTLKCNRQEGSWQWLLGRFCLIIRIMDKFGEEFRLQYVPANANEDSAKLKIMNDDRLISVLKFSLDSVNHNHSTVSKMARRVFVQASQLCSHFPVIFTHVYDMLTTLDSSLQMHLKKKILNAIQVNPNPTPTSKCNKNIRHNVFRRFSIDNSQQERCSIQASVNTNGTGEDRNVQSVNSHHRMQRSSSHSPSRVIKQPVNLRISTNCNKLSTSVCNHVPRIFTKNRQQVSSATQKPLKRPTHLPLINKTSNLLPNRFDSNSPTPTKVLSIEKSKLSKINSPKNVLRKLFSPSQPSFETHSHGVSLIGDELECSTGDLIDLTPSSPLNGWSGSFRSEVQSPNTPSVTSLLPTSPAKYPDEAAYDEEIDRVTLCVEEINQQNVNHFPEIPGLSKENMNYEDDPAFIIHIQPEIYVENDKLLGSEKRGTYQQHLHWNKGPLLGTGAFSTCFQARDIKSGTLMAVKQAAFCRNSEEEQDKVIESITEEITMMAKLDHPNIVRILGATQQGENFNMFFEWMAGGSVAGLLDKYGPFTECVVYNYTLQVLHGLAYLHDNQILHRDLKGANLLVDSTGRHLRIGDFGAAARLASQTTVAGEFQGQLLGTIAFMAPEVLRGEDYGRSCDIWSVGCVIIEMVTSKPPWNANNISNHLALIFKIACSSIPPPIPDHLSKPLKNLIQTCLMMKCDERSSAKQLLIDYKHVLT